MKQIILPNNYRRGIPGIVSAKQAPAFNRIKNKELFVKTPKLGLGNWFRVEVEKPGRGVRFLSPWFHNHVTDQGLDLVTKQNGVYAACQVGSGNAPPSDADTGLQSYTAGTSSKSYMAHTSQTSVSPYYVESYWRYNFALGAFNDDILSEVMIGTNTSGGSCFSRELIRDAVGAPTTIQVASDEILRVHHKLRLYPPMVDVVGTVDLDIYEAPTTFDYVRRAGRADSNTSFLNAWSPRSSFGNNPYIGQMGSNADAYLWTGGLGLITGTPGGGRTQMSSTSAGGYSDGSFTRDGTLFCDTNVGNGT